MFCFISLCGLILTGLMLLVLSKIWRRRDRIGDISNRLIVITGCDSGFGNAFCQRLDKAGVPVLAGCLSDTSVSTLSAQLSSRSKAVQVDVTQHESVLELRRQAQAHCAANGFVLWGLVNNAGAMTSYGPVDWFSGVSQFMPTLSVNTLGLIDVTLVFLPLLKHSKGRIVNVSSICGRLSSSFCCPYSTSKFAVEGFSDCLRREMARFQVKVATIEPGMHRTNLVKVERLKQLVEGQFEALGPEQRVGYDEQFVERLVAFMIEYCKVGLDDLTAVQDAFDDALFALEPSSRYVVGPQARFIAAPLSLLPDSICDFLLDIHIYLLGFPICSCFTKGMLFNIVKRLFIICVLPVVVLMFAL